MNSHSHILILAGLAMLHGSTLHAAATSQIATSSSPLPKFKQVSYPPAVDTTAMKRGFLIGLITPVVGAVYGQIGICRVRRQYGAFHAASRGYEERPSAPKEIGRLLANQAGVQNIVTEEKITNLGSAYIELMRTVSETGAIPEHSTHIKTCDDILGATGLIVTTHNALLERLETDDNFYPSMLIGSGISVLCLTALYSTLNSTHEASTHHEHVYSITEKDYQTLLRCIKEDLD